MTGVRVRTIRKHPQPQALAEWRTARLAQNQLPATGMDCTYAEMRRDARMLQAVERGLLAEQGSICGYTGMRLLGAPERAAAFHLEHLIPQAHCARGEDADYRNLIACWPQPNCGFEPAFGARKKGAWPSPSERHLFVSPLDPRCTASFSFNHRGEIAAATPENAAANETIDKLGLADPSLTAMRRSAIQGALSPASRQIKLKEARKLLREIEADTAKLDRGEPVRLRPFCFAIEQALVREIRKLEGIMRPRRS